MKTSLVVYVGALAILQSAPHESTDYPWRGVLPGIKCNHGGQLAVSKWHTNGIPPVDLSELQLRFPTGKAKVISSLNQLKGIVTVSSSAEALRFVRLRTSLYTAQALPSEETRLEIVSEKQIDDDLTFGYWEAIHRYQNVPEGFFGLVKAEPCTRITERYPKIIRTGDRFVVTRLVALFKGAEKGVPEEIVESVGKDGSYAIETEHAFRGGPLSEVCFFLPHAM